MQIAVLNCMFTMSYLWYTMVYHYNNWVYMGLPHYCSKPSRDIKTRHETPQQLIPTEHFLPVCMPGGSPPRWRVASRQSPRNDLCQAALVGADCQGALFEHSLQMSAGCKIFRQYSTIIPWSPMFLVIIIPWYPMFLVMISLKDTEGHGRIFFWAMDISRPCSATATAPARPP